MKHRFSIPFLTRFMWKRDPFALAWSNFKRHSRLTFATVSLIALMVLILNVILGVQSLAQRVSDFLNERVDVSLEVNSNVDDIQIADLINRLSKQDFVQDVRFVSRDDALATVDSRLIPGYKDFIERNTLENPFPSSIQVFTNSLENHQKLVNYILESEHTNLLSNQSLLKLQNETEIIADETPQHTTADQLRSFSNMIFSSLFIAFIIFFIASLAILINALYLSLQTNKKELTIMQLVGATEKFVLLPYAYEGVLYGFFSVVIGLATFYAFLLFAGTELFFILFSPLSMVVQLTVVTFLSGCAGYLVVLQYVRGKMKL